MPITRATSLAGLGTVFDGTELRIGSSTDTGTANQLLQVTGGTYVSDNVGIGITNPDKKLVVKGTGGNFVAEFSNTNNASNNNGVYISVQNTAAATQVLNVGTPSSQALLVQGDGTVLINNTSATGTASQPLQVTGGAYVSGSVGIGTTNPQGKLHIQDGTLVSYNGAAGAITTSIQLLPTQVVNTSGTGQRIEFRSDVVNSYIEGVRDTAAGPTMSMRFGVFNSEIVRINSTGVGIATTNPIRTFHIHGTTSSEMVMESGFYGDADSRRFNFVVNSDLRTPTKTRFFVRRLNSSASGGSEPFLINADDQVIVGNNAAFTGYASTQSLHVMRGAHIAGYLGVGVTSLVPNSLSWNIETGGDGIICRAPTTTGIGSTYVSMIPGSDVPRIEFYNNGVYNLSIGYRGSLAPSGSNYAEIRVPSNNPLLLCTNNAERVKILEYGSVGFANTVAIGGTGVIQSNLGTQLHVRSDRSGGRGGEISIINYVTAAVGNEAALNFGLDNTTYDANNGNAQIKAIVNAVNGASDLVFSNWNGTNFLPNARINSNGTTQFGPGGVGISSLSWGTDASQVPHIFSGRLGAQPADGAIVSASAVTNASNQRISSFIGACPVSGTSVTVNPSLKSAIEIYTNTNVGNAADTGGYIRFQTKPDNTNLRLQMTLNSNGVLTRPYQVAFFAYTSGTSITANAWQKIAVQTEVYDVQNNYDTTLSRFTAPVAGKYFIFAGGFSGTPSTGHDRYAHGIVINGVGSPVYFTGGNYSATDTPLAGYSIVYDLAANDYVEMYVYSAIAATWGASPHKYFWGGYLL